MVQRVDEGQSRCAVESPSVVEGGCDTNGGFVDIWNAEVDFPHFHQDRCSHRIRASRMSKQKQGFLTKLESDGRCVLPRGLLG